MKLGINLEFRFPFFFKKNRLSLLLPNVPFCQRHSILTSLHFQMLHSFQSHTSRFLLTFWNWIKAPYSVFFSFPVQNPSFFFFFLFNLENKASYLLRTPHGEKPRNCTDPVEDISWEARVFHRGKPICNFVKQRTVYFVRLSFYFMGFVFAGAWRHNAHEVLDCKVDGPRQSSKDVCPVAEVESFNGAQWVHFRIRNSRWTGTQKDLSSGFIKGWIPGDDCQSKQAFPF